MDGGFADAFPAADHGILLLGVGRELILGRAFDLGSDKARRA